MLGQGVLMLFFRISNFQSWNLQLRSLPQTNVARPIYPHHHPCTLQPVWKCIRPPTGQLSAFHILPTVPQKHSAHSIPHFTFRIPHATIPHWKCLYTGLALCGLYILPHFTNSRNESRKHDRNVISSVSVYTLSVTTFRRTLPISITLD